MDRPILFSAPMIRALLDGRKRQTRRILKLPTKGIYIHPQMGGWAPTTVGGGSSFTIDRYGNRHPAREMVAIWHQTCGTCITAPHQVGDRLWVREAFFNDADEYDYTLSSTHPYYKGEGLIYKADCEDPDQAVAHWVPSIHMPRACSRLTLTVTDVRVQRLIDISEADAIAEGIYLNEGGMFSWRPMSGFSHARLAFFDLWLTINGQESFESNPFVAAYTFSVEQKNIDA